MTPESREGHTAADVDSVSRLFGAARRGLLPQSRTRRFYRRTGPGTSRVVVTELDQLGRTL